MLSRMVRPTRRAGTANYQFTQHIPWDIKGRAVGMRLELPIGDKLVPVTIKPGMPTIRASLRTSDAHEAKIRNAEIAAYLETVWQSLRQEKPIALTHKQAVALSGDLYRAWADEEGDRRLAVIEDLEDRRDKTEARQSMAVASPHLSGEQSRRNQPVSGRVEIEGPGAVPLHDEEALEWRAVTKLWDTLGAGAEPEDLETHLGPLADKRLRARGIGQFDAKSRSLVLREFWRALADAFESRSRQAEGDYEPDPKAQRFPEWEDSTPPTTKPGGKLADLVEAWWKEAKATGRAVGTYEVYKATMVTFTKFLKHDNAARVTTDDVRRFKDTRLGKASPATIRRDLAGLKAVFAWAVANGRMTTNPAKDVTIVQSRKPATTRPKGFTPEEARTVLIHARDHRKTAHEAIKTSLAKRWVPWLCAYTGARVGELVQLRKQDVRYDEATKAWVITITPEAGTVKDKQAREVPLHPHLIELGFIDFVVKRSKAGYLFLEVPKGRDMRAQWKWMRGRVSAFIREVVPDPAIKRPNHAWRHAFKTIGREAGMQEYLLDAICGHAPRTVGGSYGEVPLKPKVAAIDQFPRFEVD